jgi:nucleotidyltransferase substrate binding protein (TIGR01987 family)
MKLDLTNLQNAIGQLDKAIKFSESPLADDPEVFEQFRNSVVQCFEYTYELSWKYLKRQIEKEHANPSIVDEWEFKELIREASTRGFIDDPQQWFLFRRLRNISSHGYDKTKADEVLSHARQLWQAADFLFKKLQEKNK